MKSELNFDDALDVGSFLEASRVSYLVQQQRAAVAVAEIDHNRPELFVIFLADDVLERLVPRSGGLPKLIDDVHNVQQYSAKLINVMDEDKRNDQPLDSVLVNELARLLREGDDVNCALLPAWLACHLVVEFGITKILVGCPAANLEYSDLDALYVQCYMRFEETKDQSMLLVAEAIGVRLASGSKKGKYEVLLKLSELSFGQVTIALLSGLARDPHYLYESRKLWPNFMSQASEIVKDTLGGIHLDRFLGRFHYNLPGSFDSEPFEHLEGFESREDGGWRVVSAEKANDECADEMGSLYDVEIEKEFDEFQAKPANSADPTPSAGEESSLSQSTESDDVFLDSREYFEHSLLDDNDEDNDYVESEIPVLLNMWCTLTRNFNQQYWWAAQLQPATAIFMIQLLMKFTKSQEFAHELGVILASKYGWNFAQDLPSSVLFTIADQMKKKRSRESTNCWHEMRKEILRRILMEKSRTSTWKAGLQLLLSGDCEEIQKLWLHSLYEALPVDNPEIVGLFRQLCFKVQSYQPSPIVLQCQVHELHV